MIKGITDDILRKVYSFTEMTDEELRCKFFQKLQECIELCNNSNEILEWLKSEGLGKEVNELLTLWKDDGTLDKIINIDLFNNLKTELVNKINEIDEQLKTKPDTSKIEKITGYEFLEKKGQDISDLLQHYIDNNYTIVLPDSYNFVCSKPIMVNKKTIIHGNNSLIKFTYQGARGLFEQNNNGASLECYDLITQINDNQIAYDFRLTNRDSGTHVRLYNCTITGNKANTKGVLMMQNDFSCIKDTKFWSIAYPINATSTQRSNTQLVFENVGIVDCLTGVELGTCDKVSLINVDIATCEFGFKILNGNRRIKFLNCHVESIGDTGFAITDNVKNDDIIYENCSVLVPTATTKNGFYCGRTTDYGISGLKYINCGGEIGNARLFNIQSPVYFYGNINANDNFISYEDSYINTHLILNDPQIPYKQAVYTPGEESFAGTTTFTAGDDFNKFNFSETIYINHTFDTSGYYEITYNAYNGSDDHIFLGLQQNGGTWTKPFSSIRLNKGKVEQKVVFYIETPASYRMMFSTYGNSNLMIKNMIVKNIKI